ncbi:MAG: 50S ribosomal protein L11 methyltransferase [Burkholderiales bacterium]
MYWNQVCVETAEEAADLVSSVLLDAGAGGVEIAGGSALPAAYDEYRLGEYSPSKVTVKAYYGEDGFDETLRSIRDGLESLKTAACDTGTLELTVKKIEDTDWNENFKKHFTTFRAAGNIIVKPSWEQYESKPGETVLEIDPGMAFGSGVHETTRMCLELIQKYMPAGADVLDIGCGSGILGIACAKLGAKKVLALDNDPVSVKVTEENAAANGVSVLTAKKSDLLANASGGKYDVITSNIIADIIIRLNAGAAKYLKPGGVYIMSGIIMDRLDDVLKSLDENGFAVIDTLCMADWRALAARLKGASS